MNRIWPAIACAALSLSGCGGTPIGQVAAIVGGAEITRREILVELEAMPPAPGTSPQVAERQALDRLIDRKLLLAGARERMIDRSPDFQIRARRAREIELADRMIVRLRAQQRDPDAATLTRYIAEHPQMFAERRQAVIDRITTNSPADASVFIDIPSNDAVAAQLAASRIGFHRALVLVDTADLSREEAGQLPAAGARPRISGGVGNALQADAALIVRPVTLSRAEMEAAAREHIIEAQTQTALRAYISAQRRAIRVREQPPK
jgi:peptidyl-prolyl cis-trans isomerase C